MTKLRAGNQEGFSRRKLLELGLTAVVLRGGSLRREDVRLSSKPNILFLMADQHRGDCVGADGNLAIETPNLDRLGAEGALFRRAYSSTPSCVPARAAILTGLSPWRHGMLGYGQMALRYKIEMPRALREKGYYTLGIGKMHYYPQRSRRGFYQTILDEDETLDFRSDYSAWFYSEMPSWKSEAEPSLASGLGWNDHRCRCWPLPERLHPTRWTADTAVSFLRNYEDPSPFFLKVSFMRPHSPYDPPPRWLKRYEQRGLPKAVIGVWAERHAERGKPHPNDLWRGDVGEDQVFRSRQGYYGSVSFVDEQIGRIIEVLEQRGWLENTLILYTADHGDMTGDHYLWRKCYAYEGSARVPMLVRWPESLLSAKRGQTFSQPVELRDILPTFLDAANVSTDPHQLDGRSLLELVRGKTAEWREFVDLEHDICYSPENHWNAQTDGCFKYIFHALDGEQQLFDLESDPGEVHDLASDPMHGPNLRLWRQRLLEHLTERGKSFVMGGRLALRSQSFLYSPNFPGPRAPGSGT